MPLFISFGRRLMFGSPFAFVPGASDVPVCNITHPARMAKLVDAPGLGPDASNGVGVRVPLLAPQNFYYLDDFHGNCSRNFR